MKTDLSLLREEPLNEAEARLWDAVMRAHAQSAMRNNISSDAVWSATAGSRDYTKAIAAALMTIGGPHAPLEQTFALLQSADPAAVAAQMVRNGRKVPGWGNSFHKGVHDPLWNEVREIMETEWRDFYGKTVARITETLHALNKPLFPNPSTFTAATAIILGIPAPAAAFIFISGRLAAWTAIHLNRLN